MIELAGIKKMCTSFFFLSFKSNHQSLANKLILGFAQYVAPFLFNDAKVGLLPILIPFAVHKLTASLLEIESATYDGANISDDTPVPASGGWVEPTYSTLGILSIPKLDVRLPVISESTNENLRISCCKISGLANDKPNRLVIAGHNIRSHFKGLDTLQAGDQIAFTAKDGVTYYYSAIEFVDLHKTEGAQVLSTDGWDITLITCKTDNTWRTVVRFLEMTD